MKKKTLQDLADLIENEALKKVLLELSGVPAGAFEAVEKQRDTANKHGWDKEYAESLYCSSILSLADEQGKLNETGKTFLEKLHRDTSKTARCKNKHETMGKKSDEGGQKGRDTQHGRQDFKQMQEYIDQLKNDNPGITKNRILEYLVDDFIISKRQLYRYKAAGKIIL